MKILFLNLPYSGHIIPTFGLVQEFIKKGCQVSYLITDDWKQSVESTGAQFIGYPNHRQLSEQIKYAYSAADQLLPQFDLLIYEQFFFLGKQLAEKHQKPVVRIFTAPVANHRIMKEYLKSGPLSIFQSQWIAKAFTKDIVKNTPFQISNWLDEIMNHPPELNLVYTLRSLQPDEQEFNDRHYKFLGPSIYDRNEPSFEFIKKEKPVLYISLGTVLKKKRRFFQTCMDAFQNENIDVILSTGEKLPDRIIKKCPDNVHIYTRVPQLSVLQIADAFITHGGMNSICEALTAQVPMLVIPFSSDQPLNARSIEALGTGIQLHPEGINKEILKEHVFSLISSKEIKNNLNQVQKLIENSYGNSKGAEIVITYYNQFKQKTYRYFD